MSKSTVGPSPLAAKSDRDWMAEDDHRTLTRAAEVLMDRQRFKRAMSCMRVKHAAEGNMMKVLSGMRMGGKSKGGY